MSEIPIKSTDIKYITLRDSFCNTMFNYFGKADSSQSSSRLKSLTRRW